MFIITIAIAFSLYFAFRVFRLKAFYFSNQYHHLFVDHPIPMCIIDEASGKFVAVNKASVSLYGYNENEFLNLPIGHIRVKDEYILLEDDMKLGTESIKNAGIRKHRTKSGEIVIAEVSLSRVTFRNRSCIMVSANDMTEVVKRKEQNRLAEEETARKQAFTTYVLDNFPVDVAVFDENHRYILLNKIAVRNDEMRKWMIGKDDFDYFARKGSDLSNAEIRRKRFLQAVEGNSTEWIDQHTVDGKTKYILRKFLPYRENGELKYVYGYGMDITELTMAQLRKEEYLRKLETMTFSTSHKIRPPICNLKGLVSLLESECLQNPAIADIVSSMQQSISVMDEFTRELGLKLHEFKEDLSIQEN